MRKISPILKLDFPHKVKGHFEKHASEGKK